MRALKQKLGMLMVLVCMAGCNDDSDELAVTDAGHDAGQTTDASVPDASAVDAATPADASVPRSLLRPSLERPPQGKLPDELKPPR